jgi:hypothetical protein
MAGMMRFAGVPNAPAGRSLSPTKGETRMAETTLPPASSIFCRIVYRVISNAPGISTGEIRTRLPHANGKVVRTALRALVLDGAITPAGTPQRAEFHPVKKQC